MSLEVRLRAIEEEISEQRDHIAEMHDRTTAIMVEQTSARRLAYAILSSVLALFAFLVVTVLSNKGGIEEIRRDQDQHTAQGHPDLREAVVEVRTEVRGLTQSVDRLSGNIELWRRDNEDLMAGSGRTPDRGGRGYRSGSNGQ